MAYDHRRAVTAAEDHVLQLGKLLETGSLSDLIHPSHAKPDARWRDAHFTILRNESEEQESDEKFRKIYTPLAHELSGFMHRITDGAMTVVLENTDYSTFFEPAYQILVDHMVKPRAKGPKPGAKSAPEPAWELLAMRAIISHALAWLKKVKPKAAQPEVTGLIEGRPASYEEFLRRDAERGFFFKKDSSKDAKDAMDPEDLLKSIEGLSAGVKGLADSIVHETLYIAGIPGCLTQKAWFPQLSPFLRITEKQLKKVHKALVRRKLDPAPAMNQLYAHYLVQCGHLGMDSKPAPGKVDPPQG